MEKTGMQFQMSFAVRFVPRYPPTGRLENVLRGVAPGVASVTAMKLEQDGLATWKQPYAVLAGLAAVHACWRRRPICPLA